MMAKESKIGIIILAAGKGTRMKSDKLKVMHEINNLPLIEYVMQTAEMLDTSLKPVVVVCNDDPAVQNYLKNRATYAVQKERLGTGHAVMMAEDLLKGKAENIVVLYGDMPFLTTSSIKKLLAKHLAKNNQLTLMTTEVKDFNEWRESFYDYGRIVRGGLQNKIVKVVEKKDATEKQLKIKEVNTSLFCFRSDWLWENLKNIKNNNKQGEYYLTDLVGLAFAEGQKLSAVAVDPKEAVGINTINHLEIAANL